MFQFVIAENVKRQFDIFSVPIFFCCATFEKFILLSVCVAKWLRKVYSFTRAERMQWQREQRKKPNFVHHVT